MGRLSSAGLTLKDPGSPWQPGIKTSLFPETVQKYLPDLLLLLLGLGVMALLLYLIASSNGFLALLGIIGLAVVWCGFHRHLIRMLYRQLGVEPEDEDDLPSFPG